MSISFTTKCPQCCQTLQVKEARAGRSIRCRLCSHYFRLESFQAETPDRVPTIEFAETCDNSADSHESEMPPLKSLGRFQLKEELGKGGFGRVYLAYDPYLDRLVALKVPLFGSAETNRRERFLKEGRSQSRLRHDAIVPAYECGEIDGSLYIVFEYIEGESLSSRIHRGRVERLQAVEWVRDVADALAFAHANSMIHRDVKPHNILLTRQGRPLITDFGLVCWLEDDRNLTKSGSFTGTIPYMAPELLDGSVVVEGSQPGNVSQAVDQYSLGVVLFELLTGHRPFEGQMSLVVGMKVTQNPPRPRMHDPSIPNDLEAICLKAIQRDPKDRYEDCAALKNALTTWLTEHAEKTTQSSEQDRPASHLLQWIRTWSSRKAFWLFASLPVMLCAVTAILFVWNNSDPIQIPGPPDQEPPSLNLLSDVGTDIVAQDNQQAWAKFRKVDVELTNTIGMQFFLVPPGQFEMGCSKNEFEKVRKGPRDYKTKVENQERPPHTVSLTEPRFMAAMKVTRAAFEEITGKSLSNLEAADIPEVLVRYEDAMLFCQRLSDLPAEKQAGRRYRLPTEAEWEFTCRAGNSEFRNPNDLGLRGMFDGFAEWCADWFDTFEDAAATDPTGPLNGTKRVVRGGKNAKQRPSHRDSADPDAIHGFRVVMELNSMK